MDLVAAIAAEPTLIPLWGAFLFALGMYPVGMLFGCRECCEVCKSCCRDAVGQVVIDFELQGTGTQVVKETPWIRRQSTGGEFTVDGTEIAPYFILEGQSSGARWLVPSIGNDDQTISPDFTALGATPMGRADQTEFVDGESVTATPFPNRIQVVGPSITASVSDCARTFTGNPGKWEMPKWLYLGHPALPAPPWDPPQDLTVDCQADEGSVIFDVPDHDNRQPVECDSCVAKVIRAMSHPASFPLSHCGNAVGGQPVTWEQSSISVEVPLMSYGPKSADNCGDELAAVAEITWTGVTGGGLNSFCQTTTTYTIDAAGQDCSPLEAWPSETVQVGPGEFEEQLVTLSATACFGGGFAGRATEPIGIPGVDDGPLAAVEVTEPGGGYAVLGRVEPTLVTISSDNGSGAELVVTWTQDEDACGRPVWRIDTVAIGSSAGDDGGSGYVHDETLDVTVSPPVFQDAPAVLKVVSGRVEPQVTISTFTGSGADLTIAWDENAGPPPTWSIDAITVVDGGSGYQYGQYASFAPATESDFVVVYGTATMQTQVSEPTLILFGGTGTSAVLSVTLASNGGTPETWCIDGVTITDGGAGYAVDDELSVNIGSGDVEVLAAVVTVGTVGSGGEILSISIQTSGEYYHDDGVIDSITVDEPGQYWRASGEIESVTVEDGGAYYEEDSGEPALVADITINIGQSPPSAGGGAEISAVVDDDPASGTFGQITGLTIDAGGDDYLAVHFEDGPCAGPGGPYRESYVHCGITNDEWFVPELIAKPFLFRRGCPDYTYSITIDPA